MRTKFKLTGAAAACLMAASLLGASSTAFASSEDANTDGLPAGTDFMQVQGQEVPVADHYLTATELAAIGAEQTAEEIAAITAMDVPGLEVQVLLDFTKPSGSGPTAAVLAAPDPEPEIAPLTYDCFYTTGKGASWHGPVGGSATIYGYCGDGWWTGTRGNNYQYRNRTTDRTHLFGPSTSNWQACEPEQTCTYPRITLGYVSV